MKRKIAKIIRGQAAMDGAGVKLTRVLGNSTIYDFDPFLMLDAFDSMDYRDYMKGFPMHPHRGIETVTFLAQGSITHRDSMGNEDTIESGEVQWMTARSGILHEEILNPVDRLLGLQLWLNLPKDKKMVDPNYHRIRREDIEEMDIEAGKLRLLTGEYEGHKGFQSSHLPLNFYHLILDKDKEVTLKSSRKKRVFIFTLLGKIEIEGQVLGEKEAGLMTEGDSLTMMALDDQVELVYLESDILGEEIAWAGPIVMNTRSQLIEAYDELDRGDFIKSNIIMNEEKK